MSDLQISAELDQTGHVMFPKKLAKVLKYFEKKIIFDISSQV